MVEKALLFQNYMTLLELKSYKLRQMEMIKLWTIFSPQNFVFYLTCSLKEVLSLKNKTYEKDVDDMFYITFPD